MNAWTQLTFKKRFTPKIRLETMCDPKIEQTPIITITLPEVHKAVPEVTYSPYVYDSS